jgi:hypothetical protein
MRLIYHLGCSKYDEMHMYLCATLKSPFTHLTGIDCQLCSKVWHLLKGWLHVLCIHFGLFAWLAESIHKMLCKKANATQRMITASSYCLLQADSRPGSFWYLVAGRVLGCIY